VADGEAKSADMIYFNETTVLKIVIYVENHPHRPVLWLADYHSLGG